MLVLFNCSGVPQVTVGFGLDTDGIMFEVAIGSNPCVEVYSVILKVLRGSVTLGDKTLSWNARVKLNGSLPSH